MWALSPIHSFQRPSMGIMSWDLDGGGFSKPRPELYTPRLTIRCEYPDTDLPPTEVTFRLSPSYGLTTGHEANEWFIDMLHDHEEFEVETDEPGEPPLSFWSETVRGVMVE